MLGNLLALFKARKDPKLAKSIASDMVIDGTIDRISWPLAIARFWMSLGLLGSLILTILFLWIGIISHWAFALPALFFGGIIYAIVRFWRGLNEGVERISQIAKTELKKRTETLEFPSIRESNP
jgi:hypothetical protein